MKQTLFRQREARAPLIAFLSAIVGAMSLGSNTKAADFSGNAALTTDYVWRGSTQTQGEPAVQAGFKVAGKSGLYASVWSSNVKFAAETRANAELDFTVGWGKALNDDWAVDVNVLRYQYPATALDLNWIEFNGTLTYKDHYWAAVGHSNEALGYDAAGTYVQAGAKFPINDAFRIEVSVAHYFLSDEVVARSGYSHAQFSGVWAFKDPFELRVTAHATDSDAKAIFGDAYAGSRIEAALQASF
ncbi:MAG: hypothetical protein BGP25_02905 [Lysobacterales bacterium 63-13]|nr:MAG: hypothetical protein BGP25_02905 [Xanthomonadales bacterium 63-13]